MANYITPDGAFETTNNNVFKKPLSTFNPSTSILDLKYITNSAEEKDRAFKSEEERKKASGRYIIIKDSRLMKEGKQLYSSLIGNYKETIIVKELKVGDVVDIVKSGKGDIPSPHYLSLKDGTFINAIDAKKEGLNGDSESQTKNTNQSQTEPLKSMLLKPLNLLIIGGALVLGFLAYKKLKK